MRLTSYVPDLAEDTVADPVVIPPLDRIHLYAIHLNRVMDVVAAGKSRSSAPTHHLFFRDGISDLNIDLAHVAVDTLQPVSMIDHNTVAIDT